VLALLVDHDEVLGRIYDVTRRTYGAAHSSEEFRNFSDVNNLIHSTKVRKIMMAGIVDRFLELQ
jgi:hypothetical protein